MSSFRAVVLIFLSATSAAVAILVQTEALPRPPAVAAAVVSLCSLMGVSLLLRDIRSKVRGEGRTLGSLLGQYAALKAVGWLGKWQRAKLEADTLNVRKAQEETLLSRLRKNEHTLYGKRFDFASIKDSDTFRSHHPITTYEHYRDLVGRVASGEERVLTAEKPLVLAMTSGTSGPSAMLLSTKDTNSDFFLQGVAVCLDTMRRAFPATDSLQRTTKFFYTPTFRQSEAGIPIGPNSSTPASSRHMLHLYTTPPPAFQVASEKDALYLHLLFALKDPSVGTLESNFASTVYYAFSTLQERWQELTEDVECGTVSGTLHLEPHVRAELEALTRPDPERAAQLRADFGAGFRGIAGRLWPRLNLILAVDSGSNQIYGEMLRDNCCSGIPFYSPFYAATEGLIGVNLWPEETSRRYLLCPRSMFCEFLPESLLEDEAAATAATLLMEDVKVGQNYELVVTNAAGLFRYRIGDVVKVVGFHHQCPIVEFQYRRSQMLNVRGEKLSEALFLDALKEAVVQWPPARLLDYCCAESGIMGNCVGSCDPHYQVFLELSGVRNLSEEQRHKLDVCLQRASAVYRSFRIKGSIGPPRVQLVGRGAFAELRQRMMSSSLTSANTFKMQRVLRRKEDARFLLARTVS
ncbi:GH3 domain-containing protein [Hippocampus comes]|uniref:GH3 domain containing n=1 Tax=Hippocampus comes TaxID=109280 RepID=A0A3Q3DIF2_HIPCM|nr:PREDICTED: GH3 domain-containing protein [Hippocampus comes]